MKSSWRKLKAHSSEHIDDKKASIPTAETSENFSGLDGRSEQQQYSLKPKTNAEQG